MCPSGDGTRSVRSGGKYLLYLPEVMKTGSANINFLLNFHNFPCLIACLLCCLLICFFFLLPGARFIRRISPALNSIHTLCILVPRAYDPSGLRKESRALGATISGMGHRMKTELNRMGRIRLFPLLFQNRCSQSSRFVLQAGRIVGSGDENVHYVNV